MRSFRVFVSSTFRDMHEEREHLIKRVFTRLRMLCEQRGVGWGEVDLRWGITNEDAERGNVLPICLAEVSRCQLLIVLLGERYGWVPRRIEPELIDEYPWLAHCGGDSLTELEIKHGALNRPTSDDRALFYFRDPGYLDRLRDGSHLPDFLPESDDSRLRLHDLKRRIRASRFQLREPYTDPAALAQMVLDDLTDYLARHYPEPAPEDALDRESAAHRAFAVSRTKTYIGCRGEFARLDAHVDGTGLPITMVGESGSGKSALLANWADRLADRRRRTSEGHWGRLIGWSRRQRAAWHSRPAARAAPTAELVIEHYVGASPRSADWAAMLRRIIGELQKRLGLRGEIPDKPVALRANFSQQLNRAAEMARVILIIDAVDQLEDRDQALDLAWVPHEVPVNVRLVFSTTGGRTLAEIQRRRWPTLEISPLDITERIEVINRSLALSGKRLAPALVRRIGAARQTTVPLYLKTLVEELRVFGRHEQLQERVEDYLEATSVDQLYNKVLGRLEVDYGPDRTRDALSLLWSARHGLSEPELLDLLGQEGSPLPGAYWSPLYLAIRESLIDRSGVLSFFHAGLRDAVELRNLGNPALRTAAHRRLADYFGSLGTTPTSRQVEELPWQLRAVEDWRRLAELLRDPPFFMAAWSADSFEVKNHWAQIEANSKFSMVDAYRSVGVDSDTPKPYHWSVALMLSDTGHDLEATALNNRLLSRAREVDDTELLQASLALAAILYQRRGNLDNAMAALEEQEEVCLRLGDRAAHVACLNSQGVIFKEWRQLGRADDLYRRAEQLCNELGDLVGRSDCLGNQGIVQHELGHPDRALELFREQECICRQAGDPSGLQRSLGNQAVVLRGRNQHEQALRRHSEEETICRRVNDLAGLQVCLTNQALIHQDLADYDAASELFDQCEQICRNRRDEQVELARVLLKKASLFFNYLRLPGQALSMAEEAYRLASAIGSSQLQAEVETLLNAIRSNQE
jgi:tetratricopeptide (TPR) repeat protein